MKRTALAAVGAAVAVALAAPASGRAAAEWVAGDLHAHTTFSHDSYGGPGDDNTGPEDAFALGHSVASQFAIAASRRLDYLAITDHNDVRSQRDPGFGSGGVLGLPGYENSLRGHAQMLGARRVYDSSDDSVAGARRIAEELRADGGVFQINHPAEGSTDFPDDIDWQYGYDVAPDTVEVWNISRLYQPPFPSGSSNDDAVRYWEGWLDRGARVGATGGSDNHFVATTAIQGVGQPTTWVFAEERSAAGVLEGLRRGRTFISHQPPGLAGPRLVLEADGNDDERFESMQGDTVRPGSALRVRASGAAGSLLRIITDGGRQAVDPVPVTGPEFEHRLRLPAGATWVRAELFDPDLAAERGVVCDDAVGSQTTYCRNQLLILAMTSALYLRAGAPAPAPAAGDSGRPAVARGTARMTSLGRRCRLRPFTVGVRGRSIRRVSFTLDRRRLSGARRRGERFFVRVRPRRLRPGAHRIAARVHFAPASATPPRSLRVRFSVCARPARRVAPRFTG
jgi:hypothetical protein